jgi:hypothetical protein
MEWLLMAIEPLKRIVVDEDEDGTQTTKLPSNLEMMNKLNEIIQCINIIDSKVAGLGAKIHKQEMKDMFKPRR